MLFALHAYYFELGAYCFDFKKGHSLGRRPQRCDSMRRGSRHIDKNYLLYLILSSYQTKILDNKLDWWYWIGRSLEGLLLDPVFLYKFRISGFAEIFGRSRKFRGFIEGSEVMNITQIRLLVLLVLAGFCHAAGADGQQANLAVAARAQSTVSTVGVVSRPANQNIPVQAIQAAAIVHVPVAQAGRDFSTQEAVFAEARAELNNANQRSNSLFRENNYWTGGIRLGMSNCFGAVSSAFSRFWHCAKYPLAFVGAADVALQFTDNNFICKYAAPVLGGALLGGVVVGYREGKKDFDAARSDLRATADVMAGMLVDLHNRERLLAQQAQFEQTLVALQEEIAGGRTQQNEIQQAIARQAPILQDIQQNVAQQQPVLENITAQLAARREELATIFGRLEHVNGQIEGQTAQLQFLNGNAALARGTLNQILGVGIAGLIPSIINMRESRRSLEDRVQHARLQSNAYALRSLESELEAVQRLEPYVYGMGEELLRHAPQNNDHYAQGLADQFRRIIDQPQLTLEYPVQAQAAAALEQVVVENPIAHAVVQPIAQAAQHGFTATQMQAFSMGIGVQGARPQSPIAMAVQVAQQANAFSLLSTLRQLPVAVQVAQQPAQAPTSRRTIAPIVTFRNAASGLMGSIFGLNSNQIVKE